MYKLNKILMVKRYFIGALAVVLSVIFDVYAELGSFPHRIPFSFVSFKKNIQRYPQPWLSAEDAVKIYADYHIRGKGMWSKDYGCGKLIFLDVDFDGVLEAMYNTEEGSACCNYNTLYRIDRHTRKVVEVECDGSSGVADWCGMEWNDNETYLVADRTTAKKYYITSGYVRSDSMCDSVAFCSRKFEYLGGAFRGPVVSSIRGEKREKDGDDYIYDFEYSVENEPIKSRNEYRKKMRDFSMRYYDLHLKLGVVEVNAADEGDSLNAAMLKAYKSFVYGYIKADPLYIVKSGDSLLRIAKAHGLSYEQLCKSNKKPKNWSVIQPGEKIIVAELLDESNDISLFAGKTKDDLSYDAMMREDGADLFARRTLFMRRKNKPNTDEWSIVMTAEGDWKIAEGMSEWCERAASNMKSEFDIMEAKLSKDGRFIWMVCNPHTSTYYLVCSFELATKTFRVLIDGCSIDEQSDGTIRINGKKTYLSDENGEPLGAAWYDVWMTPDGKIVRKSKPVTASQMQEEWASEQNNLQGTKNKEVR